MSRSSTPSPRPSPSPSPSSGPKVRAAAAAGAGAGAPGDPPPLQVVVGEDSFLLGETLAKFRRAHGAPAPGDLNAERFDLAKDGLNGLLEAARTLPMFAPRRWVQGDNLDQLPAKQHAALLAYVQAPSPRTTLLLVGQKLDGRWKLSQALKAAGVVQQVDVPKPRDVTGWLMQRARATGLQLAPAAAAALAERTGHNFGVLATALETLQLYAGEGGAVQAADVVALVAPTREAHVFELTQAMGQRDWPRCSRVLAELHASNASPLLVLAMVTRELRLLLAAKRWRGRPQGLAEAAGVRPFVAEALLQNARRVSERQLRDGLRAAGACDIALKTSTLPPQLALERLVWCAVGDTAAGHSASFAP